MVFGFLCLGDVFYQIWWWFILKYITRLYSFINCEKVIYVSSRIVKQQFVHRRMRFYRDDFDKNILFGPFQLHELWSYSEI